MSIWSGTSCLPHRSLSGRFTCETFVFVLRKFLYRGKHVQAIMMQFVLRTIVEAATSIGSDQMVKKFNVVAAAAAKKIFLFYFF